MVYANDEWVQVPVMQLYDTGLMQSAIQNARYMYEKAEKRMDDFYEKYGEFMSPFQKDMDRYNQIVGNIKSVVDNLYATGEDPLRTVSGRAKMAAALRSVNPAEFAAMKANAKMGYAYLDAAQKLRSQGKYSEAQELFDIMQNHGKTIGEFATRDPLTGRFNTWDRTSPIEATTLRDLTFDSYKGRTARALTEEDFKDPRLANYKYDPNYQWTGYLDSDLMKVAPGASLAIAGDPRAAFFREQARQMVIARGEEPTADAVEKQFQRNIADAHTWALIDPTKKADEFALDTYRTKNDDWLDRQRQARQHYYSKLNNDNSYTPNIFREAEALTQGQKKNVGQLVQYELPQQYYQKIDPAVQAGQRNMQDKNGNKLTAYVYSGEQLRTTGTMWVYNENDGQMHKAKMKVPRGGNYTFIPDGSMRAKYLGERNGYPQYQYWISGQFRTPSGHRIVNNTGGETQWVEVKERAFNYGQTQKKE